MADGNWDEILNQYKQEKDRIPVWGKDLIWMEKLVLHLLSNRDLSMLYPITSHFILHLSISKSLKENRGKPRLRIWLNKEDSFSYGKFSYKFSLLQHKNEGDIYRYTEESILCNFEKSLEVFDEMFEKLKVSTK